MLAYHQEPWSLRGCLRAEPPRSLCRLAFLMVTLAKGSLHLGLFRDEEMEMGWFPVPHHLEASSPGCDRSGYWANDQISSEEGETDSL